MCLTPPLPTVASTYSNLFLIRGPQDHLVYPTPSPWRPRLTRRGHTPCFPLEAWEAGKQGPLLLAFGHIYVRKPSSADSHPPKPHGGQQGNPGYDLPGNSH